MKRKEYILLSAALLIAFTSCDKNAPEPANDGDKIDFIATPFHESFIQADQARGSETGNDDMQDFGVYAYYTADAFIPGTSTPNFMCNTHVKKTSGTWTYEPLMFWPNNGKLSFFAYSPYASQGDSYTSLSSSSSTAGYPQLTYTVPDDVIIQRDLLVSVPLLNQTKTSRNADGKLPLTFRHALSCIVFKAKMTDACDFPVKVTSITLGNFKNKATLSYDVGNTPGTFSWTPTEDASDNSYLLTINNGLLKDVNLKTITTTYQPISTDNASLMLLPQGIDDSDEIKVTVEYQVTGNIQTQTITVPLNRIISTLIAGQRYSINILVSTLADLTLTCTVESWQQQTINVPEFK